MAAAVVLAALAWALLLLIPLAPWRNRHLLEPSPDRGTVLDDVTVLIAARNESELLPATLRALAAQGRELAVVVVDDQSDDGTAERAREAMPRGLTVIRGHTPPCGWSGKVWAQHQGQAHLERPLTLLLDADIELAPGMLEALRRKLVDDGLDLVSIMARLPVDGFWPRVLVPPFIYFFKLVYPFALSNRRGSRVAAAAGGCVLLRTAVLAQRGGFEAIRGQVIDDCALARLIKHGGGAAAGGTWIGQSRGVNSRRPYAGLGELWNMVARTAFTQLGYSVPMLVACSAAMLLAFGTPLAAVASADAWTGVAGAAALALMWASLVPTLSLLKVPLAWGVTLPLAAVLYLAMTWTSAIRYWRGERSRWRGRRYSRSAIE